MTSAGARRSATVEIGPFVARIVSRENKPIGWAQVLHPAYLSSRAPRFTVNVVRETRAVRLPWIGPNRVSEAVELSHDGSIDRLRAAYYGARIDWRTRRVDVRLVRGFTIGGLMRAVWALALLRRGGLLVRGVRLVVDGAARLVCGASAVERERHIGPAGMRDAFAGAVIVLPSRHGYLTFRTPFHDGDVSLVTDSPRVLSAIHVMGTPRGDVAARLTPAQAIASVMSSVCVVGREARDLTRVVVCVERLVSAIPCYAVGARAEIEIAGNEVARA